MPQSTSYDSQRDNVASVETNRRSSRALAGGVITDTEANELNEAAARAMGWELTGEYSKIKPALQIVTRPDGFSMFGLPDFCGDVMAIGYLVGWADKMGLRVTMEFADGWNSVTLRGPLCISDAFIGSGNTLGEAMCRAIEAWDKAQKEANHADANHNR